MFQDPIIKRIRETRETISEMFDHNPKKYIEFLKNKEKKHPERLAKQRYWLRGNLSNVATI